MLSQNAVVGQHWKELTLQKVGEVRKSLFINLASSYKFHHSITLNNRSNIAICTGKLIHNNGQTVRIHSSHQNIVKKFLNGRAINGSSSIVFMINESIQSLQYVYKAMGVKGTQKAQKINQQLEKEILKRKKDIIQLLVVIGKPMDHQNLLMRKVLAEKKKLKNKITDILLRKSKLMQVEPSEVVKRDSAEQNGVFQMGENTKYELRADDGLINEKKYEGGYFNIQDTQHCIINTQTKQKLNMRLVQKSLKQNRKNENIRYLLKIEHQLKIIRQIDDKSYLIKYFLKDNLVYMDRYDHSLHQYVYYIGDSLQISHKINIAKQIIEAAQSLHASNVVHRDIKASNFLLSDTGNKHQLKIIDFAESYCSELGVLSGDYACSHPFSPLECSEKKSIVNGVPEEGICMKEIDYWSVGIAIYELFFRKLPISFSRAFLYDITTSWRTELLLAVDQRQKFGLHLIEDMVTIICIKMMRWQQCERMNLVMARALICELESYYWNMLSTKANVG